MDMDKFKKDIDETVAFIESCFDEHNPGDGLTFDERIEKRRKELSKEQNDILQDSINFCDE